MRLICKDEEQIIKFSHFICYAFFIIISIQYIVWIDQLSNYLP